MILRLREQIKMSDSTDDRRTIVDELAATARNYFRLRWLSSARGSLSAIVGGQTVAITAEQYHPARLDGDDLVAVDAEGNPIEASDPTPSGDTAVHLAIYDGLDDVGAVFHLHHLEAALCSDRDHKRGFTHFHELSALAALGADGDELEANISIVELEGSQSVADAVAEALADTRAPHTPCFNVKNHGLYVWGPDLASTRRNTEACAFLFEYSWQRPMHPKKSRSISGFNL